MYLVKNKLILFFVLFVATTANALEIVLQNKKYNCTKKTSQTLHCSNGKVPFLVVSNYDGYNAYVEHSDGSIEQQSVTSATENGKVIYQASTYDNLDKKSSTKKTITTSVEKNRSYYFTLKDIKDPLALIVAEKAKVYAKVKSEIPKKFKVKLSESNSVYSCIPHQTRKLTAAEIKTAKEHDFTLRCNYYDCHDEKKPTEKLIAHFPTINSVDTNVFVINKNAKPTEFKSSNIEIYNDQNELYLFHEYTQTRSILRDEDYIDESLFIPKSFEGKKDIIPFITSHDIDFTLSRTDMLCAGAKALEAIKAKNNYIKESKEEIANSNLIEYLRLLDGALVSSLVDFDKAQSLGCLHLGKIMSPRAAEQLDHLNKLMELSPAKKAITESEVQKLFLKAKNMKDIPFDFKYDGCYARAHVMAKRFEDMGFSVDKAWLKGDLYIPNSDIQWNYHVAPVLNVKNKNGKIEKFVIDPSVNDKAVPLDTWVESIKSRGVGSVLKTTFPFPENAAYFQRTALAISNSSVYSPDEKIDASEDENMEHAIATLEDYTIILESMKKKSKVKK